MVHAYQQVPKSVKDRMLREYKEQEKARAEAALKAEKEARAKALKAKKEAAPPELTDEEYEEINRDYVYWASLENRRPEIPLGSYRAEDGVVRTANGNPDFKYYDDWKQNYPGDFLILSNQEGITPEEQRWMSHANIFAEPVPLDGRGGEGRALKNEFSKMSKEGASENARLARENMRRIQQRIDQKSITTKNASEPIENASEVMPSKAGKPKEKPPKTEGTGKPNKKREEENTKKRVLENIEKSKAARETSNYDEYLRKEKELLKEIEKKNALEGTGEASDIYKHQQYKQSLLKEDVLSNSDVIIKGEDLWDEKARSILTSDGSKIEDWAKMTSKQQYETPHGKGEVHFYQNQKTGEISPFDIKQKVSKPKKLRTNENDLFWIIELDVDFNIKGVR
ncbi:hypothetical protein J2T18_001115 [Paenibacillus polymyxa]|nr:hypothetical protein [Paenibacillus polymyxa]